MFGTITGEIILSEFNRVLEMRRFWSLSIKSITLALWLIGFGVDLAGWPCFTYDFLIFLMTVMSGCKN